MTELRKQFITDEASGDTMLVTPEGRGAVISHAHASQGTQHFHVDNLTSGTYRYIIVDISDTVNYPHTLTDYIHVEWLELDVDSSNTGDYIIVVGFLDNVTATSGDRYVVDHWSGTKTVGNQLKHFLNLTPNGWRMRPQSVATHESTIGDTNYQTDANLPSTKSPTSPDTPSGTGDMFMEIIVNAGEINVTQEMGYHTH